MAFLLPRLEYDYHALEPYIDGVTMEVHHKKHHAAYIEKFNNAIQGTELENKPVKDIFAHVSQYSKTVRDNGGGYYNHSLFWKILSPYPNGIEDVQLSDAIVKYFGTLENLEEEFTENALKRFGSGWAWLIKKNDGQLIITSTPNQDNPLMDVVPIKGTPLLCLDVWEHAYYLKYQNNRAAYVEAFWNVVNWQKVAELYNKQEININD